MAWRCVHTAIDGLATAHRALIRTASGPFKVGVIFTVAVPPPQRRPTPTVRLGVRAAFCFPLNKRVPTLPSAECLSASETPTQYLNFRRRRPGPVAEERGALRGASSKLTHSENRSGTGTGGVTTAADLRLGGEGTLTVTQPCRRHAWLQWPQSRMLWLLFERVSAGGKAMARSGPCREVIAMIAFNARG